MIDNDILHIICQFCNINDIYNLSMISIECNKICQMYMNINSYKESFYVLLQSKKDTVRNVDLFIKGGILNDMNVRNKLIDGSLIIGHIRTLEYILIYVTKNEFPKFYHTNFDIMFILKYNQEYKKIFKWPLQFYNLRRIMIGLCKYKARFNPSLITMIDDPKARKEVIKGMYI